MIAIDQLLNQVYKWAAVIFLATTMFLGITVYVDNHRLHKLQENAKIVAKVNAAYLDAYTTEWQKLFAKQKSQLTNEKQQIQATLDYTIADRDAGRIQLRKRFTCPTVSSPASTGTTSGAASAVFTNADEDFLIRGAAESDRLRAERNSVIERYNEVRDSIIDLNKKGR